MAVVLQELTLLGDEIYKNIIAQVKRDNKTLFIEYLHISDRHLYMLIQFDNFIMGILLFSLYR